MMPKLLTTRHMNKLRQSIFSKAALIMFALFSTALVMESCGQKHACGTRHQKKMRNKRIKHNTSFMTY